MVCIDVIRLAVGSPLAAPLLGAVTSACSAAPAPAPARALEPPSAGVERRSPPAEVCPLAREGAAIAVCNVGRAGDFIVKNASAAAVTLSTRVAVEARVHTEQWNVTTAIVYLVRTCQEFPAETRCISLEPGAAFPAKSWNGFACSGQCGSHRCSHDPFLRAWPVRFVVSSCDGTQRFSGPPFRPLEYEDVPL